MRHVLSLFLRLYSFFSNLGWFAAVFSKWSCTELLYIIFILYNTILSPTMLVLYYSLISKLLNSLFKWMCGWSSGGAGGLGESGAWRMARVRGSRAAGCEGPNSAPCIFPPFPHSIQPSFTLLRVLAEGAHSGGVTFASLGPHERAGMQEHTHLHEYTFTPARWCTHTHV